MINKRTLVVPAPRMGPHDSHSDMVGLGSLFRS